MGLFYQIRTVLLMCPLWYHCEIDWNEYLALSFLHGSVCRSCSLARIRLLLLRKKRVRIKNEVAASAEWPAIKLLQGIQRDFDQEWREHDLREHLGTIFLIILRHLWGILLVLFLWFFGRSFFFHWSQLLEAVDKMIFYLFPLLTLSIDCIRVWSVTGSVFLWWE